MKEGSIVERVVKESESDIEWCIYHKIPIPPMNTPFVIKRGPLKNPIVDRPDIKLLIVLEEYPAYEYNADYFAEVQPPEEISISELIAEPEEVSA